MSLVIIPYQKEASKIKKDSTRNLILRIDESEEQTRRIIRKINADARNEEPLPEESKRETVELLWTVQRLLEPAEVFVPFAEKLYRGESWRAYRRLLSLISAVALLYQHQRKRDKHGRIIAELADYEIVRKYLTSLFI